MLARGAVLNLLGQGTPLLVAVVCLPFVATGLGLERFGLLVLCWTVVGAATAFDLGFARATVRMISAALARGAEHEVSRILGTTLLAQAALGAVAAVLVFAAAPALSSRVFAFPDYLQSDGTAALRLIAIGIPVVLMSSSLRGVLSASQQFAAANAMTISSNSSVYVLSAIGAAAGWTLPAIVALLVASKAALLPVIWRTVKRHGPRLEGALRPDARTLRELVRFGSWITVSNAVLPVLHRAERLLIPSLVSLGALAFYAVPYEAVSRLAIVPTSMSSTLFPAFSRLEGRHGATLTDLVARPTRYLTVVMTIVLSAVALFADELLTIWMGQPFATHAAAPLRVLAAAFYFGAFSHVLRAALQGLGRPDLKAKLDFVNVVLFLSLLLWWIPTFGLVGAAGARLAVGIAELCGSLALLSFVAPDALGPPRLWRLLSRDVMAAAAFVVVVIVAALWLRHTVFAYPAFVVCSIAYLLVFWNSLTDSVDRHTIIHVQDWLRRKGAQPL